MPDAAILLCTFNGGGFLPRQLATYEAQTFRRWRLAASDDGSRDDTRALLSAFRERLGADRVRLTDGPKAGYVANFLSLICDPAVEATYYALSDQDDLWHPDRLARGAAWLDGVDPATPALFCTRTRLIDDADAPIGFSPLFRRTPAFGNALVQSIAGGNTMMFNAATRDLVLRLGPQTQSPSHDWLLYQLVSGAGGRVHYDPQPSVDYRVHTQNLIGSNLGWHASRKRMAMVAKGRFTQWMDVNVATLGRFRPHMTPESRKTFDIFRDARRAPLLSRMTGIARSGIFRQTTLGNLGLAAATVLNKL